MEFVKLSEEEFSGFSEQRPDQNFWQSINMAHLREWNGWVQEFVGIKDQGKIVAGTMISYRPVFMGMTFAQALRGFYIDYHNQELMKFFHEHLLSYLKSIHCMCFDTNPYLPYKQRDIDGALVDGGFDNSDVIDILASLGYHHLENEPGMSSQQEPNWMFVREIKGANEEQLLKEFDHQTRWSIHKALKIGIKVTEIQEKDLPIFKACMDHTAKRRGFVDHDLHYYEGLCKSFGVDDRLKLLLAQLDVEAYRLRLNQERAEAEASLVLTMESLRQLPNSKKLTKRKKVLEEQLSLLDQKDQECEALTKDAVDGIVTMAGAVFICVGKEIVYLFSGAYDAYLKYHPSYALQWYMMQYGIHHGYERYNFYGINGNIKKDADGYGIYEFKRGFQGYVEEEIGEFQYYLKPRLYKVYERLRQIKHTWKGS